LQAVGWAIWLTGQGLGQVAILLAPTTIAACVGFSSSLVSNAVLAPITLDEHLTRSHTFGVILLAAGGACVTVSSDHSSQEYAWALLEDMWAGPKFHMAFGFCLVVSLGIIIHALCRRGMSLHGFAFLFAVIGAFDMLVTKSTLQLLRLCAEGRHNQDIVVPPASVVAFLHSNDPVPHWCVLFPGSLGILSAGLNCHAALPREWMHHAGHPVWLFLPGI